jgi:quercetin 2,3-dioxygenase
MKRKDFLKKLSISSLSIISAPLILKGETNSEKSLDIVGYNHLPNKEIKTMKSVIHKANTRGHANHGWLNSYHSFSFANYHNPERMNFGVLRVLNDDQVAEGKGFGTHPHSNMEIISIPLSGDLEHKDSMGNTTVIKEGDIQVMSAGTGIQHSEFNKNQNKEVRFLQIWVIPNKQNVTPRYDQIPLKEIQKEDDFYQILSPNKDDQGVWIHQDAWFHLGSFKEKKTTSYHLKKSGNGIYAFVLEGDVSINGQKLEKRDGMGIWDETELKIETEANSKVLLMEVPLQIN